MPWNLKARTVIAVFCLCSGYALLTLSVAAAQESAPDVPPGLELVLFAHASGSQIYTCQADAQGRNSWTLKAPKAKLRDPKGKVIGRHYAGPTWKLKDGSLVTGKMEHSDPRDPDSIPWLQLDVVKNSGKGALAKVSKIQRVHTHGGKPGLSPCDKSRQGAKTKSSYTADYYFYAPAK